MTSLIPRETLFQDLFDFRRDFDQIFNRIMLDRPFVQVTERTFPEWRADLSPIFHATRISTAPRGMRQPQ
jgi:hypothetical protein